jgi:diguanylate cyclase (GGDEF)-like protein
LLIASILPYLGLILVSTNFGGIGIDYTAIILPPCILIIHLALSYFNFLEIQLLARERVFEDSTSGLILMNRYDQVVDHNEKSLTILSNVRADLKTETLKDLLADEQEFLRIVKKQEQTIWIIKKEEKEIYLDTKIQKIQNKNETVGFLITLTDVTEFEILKQQLMEIASTDELSGLNNRRKFREMAKAACERAERYQEEASLLMLDIDFFKKVNDTYGHQTGDEVIREFSRLLTKVFRGTDLVGRMGGEEFAVFMLHTNREAAFEKAEIFRKLIETTSMCFGTESFYITVSIGIAEFSKKASTLDTLLNSADEALYQAKKNGRNCTEKVMEKI